MGLSAVFSPIPLSSCMGSKENITHTNDLILPRDPGSSHDVAGSTSGFSSTKTDFPWFLT